MTNSKYLALATGTSVAALMSLSAVVSTSALAALTIGNTGVTTTYAREQFPSATYVTTAAGAVTVFATAASDVAVGSQISFTLSAGSFTTAPSIVSSGAVTTATFGGTITLSTAGTLSSNNTVVTFTATTQNTAAATFALGGFSIAGIGSTLSGSSAITVSVAATNSANAGNAFTAVATTVASSTVSSAYVFSASTAPSIDVANGGNGQVFRSGTSNVSFATIGVFTPTDTARQLYDNTTTYTPNISSSGDTRTVTVTAPSGWGGLSTYIAPTGSSCAATAPTGSATGTISGTTATYTGLTTASASTNNICIVNNGSAQISSQTFSAVATGAYVARTLGLVSITGTGTASTSANLAAPAYNGATPITLSYVFGNVPGYFSAVRVTNTASTTGNVFGVLTTDAGVAKSGVISSNLAAGTSVVLTMEQVDAALGGSTSLTAAAPRGRLLVVPTSSSATVQGYIGTSTSLNQILGANGTTVTP